MPWSSHTQLYDIRVSAEIKMVHKHWCLLSKKHRNKNTVKLILTEKVWGSKMQYNFWTVSMAKTCNKIFIVYY